MLYYSTHLHSTSNQWVTFVHGAGGSSSIWYKQVRDFQKHFNVLLVDLRGHGKSKKPFYEKLKQYSFDVIGDEVLMRTGALLKSVIPYLLLYRFFAFIIMPKKKHQESRNLFINEAKKLYQKEFKRWFTLISEVNPLLTFFRINDSKVPTLYIMGSEDHMFLPSITKLVGDHPSARLHVIKDCGHVVNVEQPHIFNATAIDFLKSISPKQ